MGTLTDFCTIVVVLHQEIVCMQMAKRKNDKSYATFLTGIYENEKVLSTKDF